MAQQVEHVLGKDEVTGSSPVSSSKKTAIFSGFYFVIKRFINLYISQKPNNLTENCYIIKYKIIHIIVLGMQYKIGRAHV